MDKSERSIIRWGILGIGKISQDFATNLNQIPTAIKQAVVSRNFQNTVGFAQQFDFLKSYRTLPEFFQDPDIDVVYIATPTSLHREHCLLALEHGKAVLCEKPFTLSYQEAQEVVETSRTKEIFCMEAMWLRFNPLMQKCKDLISRGEIGDICSLNLEIGYRKDITQLKTKDQGLGVMHRFGFYGISLAFYLFGEPQMYQSYIIRNKAGVDITGTILLGYSNHTVTITAGIKGNHTNEVHIVGSEGSIHISSPFIDATNLYVMKDSDGKGEFGQPLKNKINKFMRPFKQLLPPKSELKGSGFRGEIEETMICLRKGLPESPIMPLKESLAIHRLLDDLLQS